MCRINLLVIVTTSITIILCTTTAVPADRASIASQQNTHELTKERSISGSLIQAHRWAIEAADVDQHKIRQWHQAASRSAWLPELHVGWEHDTEERIELDRGSTTTPDVFIAGPEENSIDWEVSLVWDLKHLVWNDDQINIDVRSRLLVKLRNELLERVTFLYAQQGRLRDRIALEGDNLSATERTDLEWQLVEAIGRLDALTDGRFSQSVDSLPH